MTKQYTVINICAGMGTMSLAFEQAGFQVICNLVRDPKEISIISENLGVDAGYLYDVMPDNLPYADIVIGSFTRFQNFSTAGMREGRQSLTIVKDFKIIEDTFRAVLGHSMPKAFLFEVSLQIKGNDMLRHLMNWFGKERYVLNYHEFDVGRVTGSPICQRRVYLAALRRDVHAEFLFPDNASYFTAFEDFQEDDVSYTYDVKNEKVNVECKDEGLYVWRSGKYQRSEEVNGTYRIPLLKSKQRLRRITPRELARMKGIPDDYKLFDKNKKWLYDEIWFEPHMKLMSLFAKRMYDALGDAVSEEGSCGDEEQIPDEKAHDMLEGEKQMMERRFDVFVSSTYDGLQDERKEVTQAILECDCIPVGMEMFPASNLEQWKFIKKVIDKSDIYLVIIAGKYGSLGKDDNGKKMGYTEMEFEYALKQGKPVLAFLVKEIAKLERGKTESDNDVMALLMKFRGKAMTGRLVKFYQNKDDLKAKVMGSLNQIKKQINSGGWVRADESIDADVEELKRNIWRLEAEKEKLQEQIDMFVEREDEDRRKRETMSAKLDEMYKNIEMFEGQMKTFKLYMDAASE